MLLITKGWTKRRRGKYLGMHSFILSLEREDVLRALCPGLPICRIDVCENVCNAVFEVLDGIAVGVEVTSAIPLAVEVFVALQGIVRVDRDHELDAIAVCFDHELI